MTHLQAIRAAVARMPDLRAAICARINSAFLVDYQPANEFFDIATDAASVDDLIRDFAAITLPRSMPAGYVSIDGTFRADYGDDYYEMARLYNRLLKLVFLVRDGRLIPRISIDTMTEVCGFRAIHKTLHAQTRNQKAQACVRSFADFYVNTTDDASFPNEMRSVVGRDIFESVGRVGAPTVGGENERWHRGTKGSVF